MPKEYDPKEYIYNTETERWVKRDGKVGKLLIKQLEEQLKNLDLNKETDEEIKEDKEDKETDEEIESKKQEKTNDSKKVYNTGSDYVYKTLSKMVEEGSLHTYNIPGEPNTIYSFIKK